MARVSVLKQHFERASATKQAKIAEIQQKRMAVKPPEAPVVDVAANDKIEFRLHADMQTLKAIQSLTTKIERKREMLPNYLAYIEGTLVISHAGQNDVLLHLMVWALDTGDFELATRIFEYAQLNDMVMPEPFTRDVATVFAEQFAEGVLINAPAAALHADTLEYAIELLKSADIVDEVRAKLYKSYGIALQEHRPKDALASFEIAYRLNPKSGVKKFIDALNRTIQRGNTESAPDAVGGTQKQDDVKATSEDSESTAQPNT